MPRAFLSLGSNLDPEAHLTRALSELEFGLTLAAIVVVATVDGEIACKGDFMFALAPKSSLGL